MIMCGNKVKIIITQWALDSYLDLKVDGVFDMDYFQDVLKSDVLRLKNFPEDPKFENGKFWSPAKYNKNIISQGFKMKWHQVGNGKVQLRLPIGLIMGNAYICGAYVKSNEKKELRMLAKFKQHLLLIQEERYIKCGEL